MAGELNIRAVNGGGSSEALRRAYMSTIGLDGSSMEDMDSGIFSNGFGNSEGGGFGGNFGGGFGGGFGDIYGLYNDKEFLKLDTKGRMKYMEELQREQCKSQLDAQVEQKHLMEAAEFKATAAEDTITRQCGILQNQIKEDEQGQVAKEYKELTLAVREKFKEAGYTNVDETQVRAYAEKEYFKNTGARLIEDINKNGDSQFVHGLKEGASLWTGLFTSDTSAKDNIAGITGGELSGRDKASEFAGKALGGLAAIAAVGVAVVASIFLLKKGGGAVLKKLFSKGSQSATNAATQVVVATSQTAETVTQKQGWFSRLFKWKSGTPANEAGQTATTVTQKAARKGWFSRLFGEGGTPATATAPGTSFHTEAVTSNLPQAKASSASTSGATPVVPKMKGNPPEKVVTATTPVNHTINTQADLVKLIRLIKKGDKGAEKVLNEWLPQQSPKMQESVNTLLNQKKS